MEKNKKILFIFLLLAGFSVLQFFAAQYDYSWERKYLEKKGKNWIVFAKFNNAVNPLFIYSIFKTPTVRMGILDSATLRKVSENVYFVNSLWVDKEPGLGEIIKEEPFSYILDCKRYVTGDAQNQHLLPKEKIDLNKVKWISDETIKKYPEAKETIKKECEAIKNYFDSN